MEERRQGIRREKDKQLCTNPVSCPTSEREMDDIQDRLDKGGQRMSKIMKEIRINRRYHIAILSMSFLGLAFNVFMKG